MTTQCKNTIDCMLVFQQLKIIFCGTATPLKEGNRLRNKRVKNMHKKGKLQKFERLNQM